MTKSNIEQVKTVNAIKALFPSKLSKNEITIEWLIYLIISFFAAAWLPDGIMMILESSVVEWSNRRVVLGISVIIISILLICICHSKLKGIALSKKIEVDKQPAATAKVLILFLSSLRAKKDDTNKAYQTKNSIEELMGFFNTSFNPWEMSFKAINHHLPRLEKIIVLTSKGELGSDNDYELFEQMLNKFYLNSKFKIVPQNGIDFEDVKEVFEKIDGIYDELKKEKIKETDIIIDITSGQKPNSIAGALATYVYGRRFQYISTNSKDIYSYDMVPVKDED